MIAREDQQRVDAPVANVRQDLADSISSPLKPIRPFRGLFGRQDLDKAVGKRREAIRRRDVPVAAKRN
jgi:hypothetical protein